MEIGSYSHILSLEKPFIESKEYKRTGVIRWLAGAFYSGTELYQRSSGGLVKEGEVFRPMSVTALSPLSPLRLAYFVLSYYKLRRSHVLKVFEIGEESPSWCGDV